MNEWKIVTLEDVTVDGSQGLKRGPFGGAIKKEYFVSDGYKIYEQKHAIYNNFDSGNYFINETKYKELESFAVKSGDLIVSCSGTLGRIAVVPQNVKPGIINQALLRIRPESTLVSSRFLKMLLETPDLQSRLFGSAGGSAIKNIKPLSEIRQVKFPLPPLEEQKRIAEILDQAEELRRKRKEAIAQLDTLNQSIFLEMFGDPVKNPKGWSCKNLGDTCAEIYRYPTFYGFEYQTIGTPVARIGNILLDGRLDPDISNYVFIDPVISKQFPRTILELYDIVMAVRGDGSTAKRIGLVTSNSLVGANISPNLLRFKAKANISHPLFLFHFMISDKGQRLLESYVTRTAKKTITAEGIKKIKIPLPPFFLQQEFAERVEAVEELKKSHRASLSELDALFASLQHRAFRGEL